MYEPDWIIRRRDRIRAVLILVSMVVETCRKTLEKITN